MKTQKYINTPGQTPAVLAQPVALSVPERRKPGRKKTKLSKQAQILADLPQGFTFIGPLDCCTEEYILESLKSGSKSALNSSLSQVESDQHIFRIGCFELNLDEVRVQDFKKMRKLLPKPEYKLLKNRKCARLSRSRRRELTETLQT